MCLSFYFTKNYSIIVYDCSIIYKLIYMKGNYSGLHNHTALVFTFKNQKNCWNLKVLNIKNDAILMVYE